MDTSNRFNQLLILVILLVLTLFAKCALADDKYKDCYYGVETQSNLKDLQDLSQFAKNAEFSSPWVEFQYNGFSVSKSEYERLMKRKKIKNEDPNMRMP